MTNLEIMQEKGREEIYKPYEHYCNQDVVPFTSFTTPLDQHTAATWKAARTTLLTELLDSGLLEEITPLTGGQDRNKEADGHNTLARAIKAHLDELIKSNSV